MTTNQHLPAPLHVILVDAHRYITELYAPSRERSLALTKLDEAVLWLIPAERAQ